MNFIIILFSLLHPFHVGLTEMEHNPETSTFQISIKLFSDDLENALKQEYEQGIDLLNPVSQAEFDSLLFVYVSDHFELETETGKAALEFIGNERTYDVTWVYLESSPIDEAKKVMIKNELLFELFDDQTHVVHYTNRSGELSTELIHQGKSVVNF
jgi:hypothetical protein